MRNLILSTLILASAFQTAMGQTYTSGDYQYTLSNNQATIYSYIGSGGAVAIPSLLNSYLVVSIGNSTFSGRVSLGSVTIPNSVTSIGASAFRLCTGLTSITIPSSVTSIGASAFYGCTSLPSITIPNGVTSIGSSAFSGCVSLGFVSIPNSVTSIGVGAFSNSGLGSVLLPPNLSLSQISQAGFLSTAVFYVGSVGLPTSMASQADLATTQAQLATTQAELATTKSQITTAINEGKAPFSLESPIEYTLQLHQSNLLRWYRLIYKIQIHLFPFRVSIFVILKMQVL